MIGWDRGRPARNAPQVRRSLEVSPEAIFALRAHCGRDARGPSQSLDRFERGNTLPGR